jgi:hypothetical protein
MSAVPLGTFKVIRLPNFIYCGGERNVEIFLHRLHRLRRFKKNNPKAHPPRQPIIAELNAEFVYSWGPLSPLSLPRELCYLFFTLSWEQFTYLT